MVMGVALLLICAVRVDCIVVFNIARVDFGGGAAMNDGGGVVVGDVGVVVVVVVGVVIVGVVVLGVLLWLAMLSLMLFLLTCRSDFLSHPCRINVNVVACARVCARVCATRGSHWRVG